MIKRIYKYPTGAEVPKGAKYLSTIVQTHITEDGEWIKCHLVWHYFLVGVKE